MNTVNNTEPRIKAIEITEELIIADLADGRTISVPLVWSWRLADATPAQRANYQFIGDGQGVHWPDIDEDISAEGNVDGRTRTPRETACVRCEIREALLLGDLNGRFFWLLLILRQSQLKIKRERSAKPFCGCRSKAQVEAIRRHFNPFVGF